MPTVRLGNSAALHRGEVLEGDRVTTLAIHDDDPLDTRMRTITHTDGLWPQVSASTPTWVSSDDPELEAALAEHYGCPIGEPDDTK